MGTARSRADALNTYDQLLHPFDGWTFGAYAHEAGQFGLGESKGAVNMVAGGIVDVSPELTLADGQLGGRLSHPLASAGESQQDGEATFPWVVAAASGVEALAAAPRAAEAAAGVSEGKNLVGDLLYGNKAREGLPGPAGVPISGRPTNQQLENLTAKHDVEFGVTYKLGPGKNGGGGQYYLHSGSRTRIPLPQEQDRILISHTHPEGTTSSSPQDRDYLDGLRVLGSKQRSSTIIPVGGRPFRFRGRN